MTCQKHTKTGMDLTVDEITAVMAAERGITHPDDVAHLREDVARVVELLS